MDTINKDLEFELYHIKREINQYAKLIEEVLTIINRYGKGPLSSKEYFERLSWIWKFEYLQTNQIIYINKYISIINVLKEEA